MNQPDTALASPPHSKKLNIALWVVQILLAAMFGMAGAMKATQPIAQLSTMLPFAAQFPEPLLRFIGASELAGALGLILPAATRIVPAFTPLAASGIAVIMVLAAGFHISRGEFSNVPVNVVLGALAVFVAWGRTKKVPITRR